MALGVNENMKIDYFLTASLWNIILVAFQV